jgi:multidrug resistance efflux pump
MIEAVIVIAVTLIVVGALIALVLPKIKERRRLDDARDRHRRRAEIETDQAQAHGRRAEVAEARAQRAAADAQRSEAEAQHAQADARRADADSRLASVRAEEHRASADLDSGELHARLERGERPPEREEQPDREHARH